MVVWIFNPSTQEAGALSLCWSQAQSFLKHIDRCTVTQMTATSCMKHQCLLLRDFYLHGIQETHTLPDVARPQELPVWSTQGTRATALKSAARHGVPRSAPPSDLESRHSLLGRWLQSLDPPQGPGQAVARNGSQLRCPGSCYERSLVGDRQVWPAFGVRTASCLWAELSSKSRTQGEQGSQGQSTKLGSSQECPLGPNETIGPQSCWEDGLAQRI